MNIDLKKVFTNEQKYNSINLLECSIYETLVATYYELMNHENKNSFEDEISLCEKFICLYDKFSKYEFCNNHFGAKYEVDEEILLKNSNLLQLFQILFDKVNILVDDFMKIVEYNPNRVSFNKKTSVFLIAYASELKELWEEFSEEFMENLEKKCIHFNEIYRSNYMKEKLKFIPAANVKGAWAKGPLNFS